MVKTPRQPKHNIGTEKYPRYYPVFWLIFIFHPYKGIFFVGFLVVKTISMGIPRLLRGAVSQIQCVAIIKLFTYLIGDDKKNSLCFSYIFNTMVAILMPVCIPFFKLLFS